MESYDIIAIGGGTAGLVTAAGAAALGAKVALVEANRLGGECLWNGCVPSKALIACARLAHDARGAARHGIAADVRVDFPTVMAWVHGTQESIAPNDSPERFRSLGVDVVRGTARFSGTLSLDVEGRRMHGRHIVIATGSRPSLPPIDGLDEVPYLTNESIFDIERLPANLIVLGAGPIGLELAQAFARLGSRVVVLEAAPELLPREDHELASLLGERLAAEGVAIKLGTKATSVRRATNGSGSTAAVIVSVEAAGGVEQTVAQTIEGDALLVATGRSSNVEQLDAGRAGVELGKEGIIVDDRLRTTAGNVWAAGDVTGGMRFTHVADHQARAVIRNALFPLARAVDYSAVPWVTFTDPPLAHVGLTEREARERHGDSVRIWRRRYDDADRAITDGHTAGMVKLVSTSRGRLLGGHVLGAHADSAIGEITMAMQNGIPIGGLSRHIRPYPTYPEATRRAAEEFYKAKLTGIAASVVRWVVRR
ncbi:MAG: dihydrolipoyl dehydrogenase family protein [Gemmatimonadaceae bacterium]